MDLQHVNVKIFTEGDLAVDPARFIEVFHQWIRESALPGLLLDVADYRHVPDGPGVLLMGHEHDYGMDHAGGQWGLLYNRKAPVEGSNQERLALSLHNAAEACEKLEAVFAAEGPLKFSRNKLAVFINDRALAPNTAETLETVKPAVAAFLTEKLGHSDFTLEHDPDPRVRFGLTMTSAQPLDLAVLK